MTPLPSSSSASDRSPDHQQDNSNGKHPHHQDLPLHHDRQKHHTRRDGVLEYNLFRDSLLRYAGYANEVGEAFRYQLPRMVAPSYVVAFGYCLADAATSGWQAYAMHQQEQQTNEENTSSLPSSSSAHLDAAVATADTLIWQSLASVAIPGATIHQVVRWSRVAVQQSVARNIQLPALFATWFPTVLGLASIPLIIHPIDALVDELMERTFRQVDWSSVVSPSSSSSKKE